MSDKQWMVLATDPALLATAVKIGSGRVPGTKKARRDAWPHIAETLLKAGITDLIVPAADSAGLVPGITQPRPGHAYKVGAQLTFHVIATSNPTDPLTRTQLRLLDEPTTDYELRLTALDTVQKIKESRARLRKSRLISLDIETSCLFEHEPGAYIVSVAVSYKYADHVISDAILLNHPDAPSWEYTPKQLLHAWLANLPASCRILCHNASFDLRWLRMWGVDLTPAHDTLHMSHLIDENSGHGLKELAQVWLGVTAWDIDARACSNYTGEQVLTYNALDTLYTYYLHHKLLKRLYQTPSFKTYKHITMPAHRVWTRVSEKPLPVDKTRVAELTENIQDKLTKIDTQLDQLPGPEGERNYRPSNWLRDWLFDYYNLPGRSVSKSALKQLAYDYPDNQALSLLLERSTLAKQLSGFCEAYMKLLNKYGAIWTSFRLTGTVTGRLSSSRPAGPGTGINLQQVPRDPVVRRLFKPTDGYSWVEADYSQLELRVAAMLSGDSNMLNAYNSDIDLHTRTATTLAGDHEITKEWRRRAKAVNFGFLYGMSAGGFQKLAFDSYDLKLDNNTAKHYRKTFFDTYPGLVTWHEQQKVRAIRTGFVTTPTGRVRHLPDLESTDESRRVRALRQAINSPVQGFGSDICQLAMIQAVAELLPQYNATLVGGVHDSLDFVVRDNQVSDFAADLRGIMESPSRLDSFYPERPCPLRVEVAAGPSWGEVEDLT